jgi:hypothetical protein
MPGPGKPFKKGDPRPAGAGRQPGQPNYVTKNLRDLILQAAEEVGFVKRIEKFDAENKSIGFELVSTGDEGMKGYLKWAAVHQPARFLAMLTRILPMQINAKTERTEKTPEVRYRTFAEVERDLKAVGYSDEKIQMLVEDLRPKKVSAVVDAGPAGPKTPTETPAGADGGAGGDYLDEDGKLKKLP